MIRYHYILIRTAEKYHHQQKTMNKQQKPDNMQCLCRCEAIETIVCHCKNAKQYSHMGNRLAVKHLLTMRSSNLTLGYAHVK